MAEKRVVELVDDLDGGPADETVRFSIDGRDYEIDLSSHNACKFRTTLQPYLLAARRTGIRRAQPAFTWSPEGAGRSDDSRLIREWARARGLEVSPRGRIPAYLRQAYERR